VEDQRSDRQFPNALRLLLPGLNAVSFHRPLAGATHAPISVPSDDGDHSTNPRKSLGTAGSQDVVSRSARRRPAPSLRRGPRRRTLTLAVSANGALPVRF
jgi:hypothetical protein